MGAEPSRRENVMSRLLEVPPFVRALSVMLLLCGPSSLALADQSEQQQAERPDSAQQSREPPSGLAGSRLGGTVFALIEPEYAETMLLLVSDLADDGVLDDFELQDLMTTADELCEDAELPCRQVKRAIRRDARNHAKRVKRRVEQWVADGILPAEPNAQQIREQVEADRAKVVDEELVVTAPRLKNPYYRKSVPEVYRAFNSRRLGIWHYNKGATHERAARGHEEHGRYGEAEKQLAEARREFKIAFPYLLAVVSRYGIETATSFYSYFYHGSYKTAFYSVFLWIFRPGFNTNFWGTFFTSKKYTRDTFESRSL